MGWTHSICIDCWKKRRPDREPVRLVDSDVDVRLRPVTCCFCGAETAEGIYVRAAQDDVRHCPGHDA